MSAKLLSTSCPACGLPMHTAAMACAACDLRLEGRFAETSFARLAPDDQKFLEQYLLAGFSIKALEQTTPLGYAAIRSKLDRIIDSYKALAQLDTQKKAVLEQLGEGRITVEQAKQKLETLSGA